MLHAVELLPGRPYLSGDGCVSLVSLGDAASSVASLSSFSQYYLEIVPCDDASIPLCLRTQQPPTTLYIWPVLAAPALCASSAAFLGATWYTRSPKLPPSTFPIDHDPPGAPHSSELANRALSTQIGALRQPISLLTPGERADWEGSYPQSQAPFSRTNERKTTSIVLLSG